MTALVGDVQSAVNDYGPIGGAAFVAFAIVAFIDKREERQRARTDAATAVLAAELEVQRAAHLETIVDNGRLGVENVTLRERAERAEQALEAARLRIDDLLTPPTPRARRKTPNKGARKT